MKIGIIGAGKVGFSLGKLFHINGVTVTGYYSRKYVDAEEAAVFTDSKAFASIEALTENSDVIFITVPDGEIISVYKYIYKLKIENKYLCHCSGVMSASEAFPDISDTGAFGFSLHPVFPVSSKYEAYRELAGAFFCMEGQKEALDAIEPLLRKAKLKVKTISSQDKVKYHAACVMASNFMCGLMDCGMNLLKASGFSEQEAVNVMGPLMTSNLEHLLKEGPVAALTGPVERGDVETVKKHLRCLEQSEMSDNIYRALSRELVSVAKKKHPEREYREISEILDSERKEEK